MGQDSSEQKKENYEKLRASLEKIEKQEILFSTAGALIGLTV